jgi:hypothetical protein
MLGNVSSKYFRYSKGLRLFSLAVSIMLKITALAVAPLWVLQNKKFLPS